MKEPKQQVKRMTAKPKTWLHTLFVLIVNCQLSIVNSSCSKDSYHYPDVKEEFSTAKTGTDSLINTIITDDGISRQVVESENIDRLTPDSVIRLLGYYEEQSNNTVKLHSFIPVTAPLPVPCEEYLDSVPTAPVSIQSAWLGYEHINMLLNVQSAGKPHRVSFLIDQYQAPDSLGLSFASFSIHHNDGGDAQIYQSRAYASLPLYPYLGSSVRQLDVKVNYLDYDGQIQQLSFAYKPKN